MECPDRHDTTDTTMVKSTTIRGGEGEQVLLLVRRVLDRRMCTCYVRSHEAREVEEEEEEKRVASCAPQMSLLLPKRDNKSVCLSVFQFVCLSVCLSISLFVSQSVCLASLSLLLPVS